MSPNGVTSNTTNSSSETVIFDSDSTTGTSGVHPAMKKIATRQGRLFTELCYIRFQILTIQKSWRCPQVGRQRNGRFCFPSVRFCAHSGHKHYGRFIPKAATRINDLLARNLFQHHCKSLMYQFQGELPAFPVCLHNCTRLKLRRNRYKIQCSCS